jgi:hypothetical protein
VLTDLDEVVSYKAPAPPKRTGRHRYVLLAFVPSNGTTDKLHLSKPSGRKHWGYDTDKGETKGVREWADENGLAPVGECSCLLLSMPLASAFCVPWILTSEVRSQLYLCQEQEAVSWVRVAESGIGMGGMGGMGKTLFALLLFAFG